jgi:polyhydroxybutyrate depolymerase
MRRTVIAKLLRFVLLLLMLGAGTAWWLLWSHFPNLPRLEPQSVGLGNTDRSYLAFVPDGLPAGAALLIVLHGTGQDGDTIRRSTGGRFEALARQDGFAVAYPDGLDGQWNDCRPKDAMHGAIDDVGFISGIAGDVARTHGIDPMKVFVFGYSNGGQMVFRLLSERPGAFKGAATMGANLPTSDFSTCSGEGATPPLLLAQGMKDPITPFEGGKVSIFGLIDRGRALSAEQTAEAFAARNGLTDRRSDQLTPTIARWRWTNGGAAVVEQLAFADAGHVVPQPLFRFPRIMGTTPSFDLPDYVIDFFGLNAASTSNANQKSSTYSQ